MADQEQTPITAPRFYVGSFQQFMAANDCMLVLGQAVPMLASGEFGEPVTQSVAILNMSPQSAKELMLLLQGAIAQYEEAFGPLRSPFIDERSK